MLPSRPVNSAQTNRWQFCWIPRPWSWHELCDTEKSLASPHLRVRVQRSERVFSRTARIPNGGMNLLLLCSQAWIDNRSHRFILELGQDELAGGKINLKEGQELKLVTDYTFKVHAFESTWKVWFRNATATVYEGVWKYLHCDLIITCHEYIIRRKCAIDVLGLFWDLEATLESWSGRWHHLGRVLPAVAHSCQARPFTAVSSQNVTVVMSEARQGLQCR